MIVLENYDVHGHFSQTHTQDKIADSLLTLYNPQYLKYCRNCDTYQRYKSNTYKLAGLYATLPYWNSQSNESTLIKYLNCWWIMGI